MATIKRGTTPVLAVKLGIDNLADIASVDFLFKSKMLESDTVKVEIIKIGEKGIDLKLLEKMAD